MITKPHLAPLAGLVVLAAAAAGIMALGLGTADGVTHLGGDDYETEFVSAWSQLGWLLVVPVHTLARWRRWTAVPAVIVTSGPQFVGAHEVVRRYAESGWGSGLESLGYLAAGAMALAFCAAAAVGAAQHRRGVDVAVGTDRRRRPSSERNTL